MDTFGQIRTQLQIDLNIGTESTFLNSTAVNNAIIRAYRKCTGAFKWPKTMDSKKTSSINGQSYYKYPQNWRQQSMWKLKIDDLLYGEGDDGSPLNFQDFLLWQDENPNSNEKKWSTYGDKFFINPASSTNGNNNICIWGQKVMPDLVNDSDETMFSYTMPEGNEAILEEAKAMLTAKEGDINKETFYSVKALGLLTKEWNKLQAQQAQYEKNRPMFNVPDFFRTSRRRGSPRGDFN